jgi:VWFA-related protein
MDGRDAEALAMTRHWLPLAGVLVAGVALDAQQGVFRARTDVVAIDVSVMDGKNPVSSLTLNDFRLTDDGVRQTLLDVGREPLPLDITLTIDVSGSVRPDQRASIERAIQQVAATLQPNDRCAVVSFDRTTLEESPLHRPPLKFNLTQRSSTGTSIIDALLLSLVTAPAINRRQLNLVLTDGLDTSSFFDRDRLLDTLKYANGQISVVLARGNYRAGPENPAIEVLKAVTSTSGGQVVELKGDDQLSGAFLQTLDEFRTSYLLRYTPAGVPRPGWHEVRVTVPSRPRLQIRARQGYWY